MRACLAMCVTAALVGAALANCTACISGQCYRKQAIGERPFLLDIDRSKNILYSLTADYDLQQCLLVTGRCNTTTYTPVAIMHLAVDQRTGDTYGEFHNGSGYGIYKLDLDNNDSQLLFSGDVSNLIFKDKLYYRPYPSHSIFTYEDGESRVVAGTEGYEVLDFIVNKNDDIYFKTYGMGKYFITRLRNGVVDQTAHWDGVHAMTRDRDGNAVFIHRKSHAVYRATDGQLTEIGVINDAMNSHCYIVHDRPLFDRDNNIIYCRNHNIFYLKRDTGINCTYSISQNKAIITEIYRSVARETAHTYNIDTTARSSPGGQTEAYDDMFPSTPAPEPAASALGGSGASRSAARGQQARTEC